MSTQYIDYRSARWFITSALLVVVLAGCSLKSIYNRLDILIPEYVEGLVSLDDALEFRVEQRTGILLQWHRDTQLQQYADLLQQLQNDFDPALSEQRVMQHAQTIEDFWKALSAKLNKDMAELLPLLNPEQRRELFSSIDGKNSDFREDYVSLDREDKLEQYEESTLDTFDNWLGDLTREQETLITATVTELRSSAAQRLEMRLDWQQTIRSILDSNGSNSDKTRQLDEYFAGFDTRSDPVVRDIFEHNRAVMARLVVAMTRSATPGQKRYFIDKTDDYIRIFRELAAET